MGESSPCPSPHFWWFVVVLGVTWLVDVTLHFQPLPSGSGLPLSSLIKTSVIGFGVLPGHPGSSHPEVLNSISNVISQ